MIKNHHLLLPGIGMRLCTAGLLAAVGLGAEVDVEALAAFFLFFGEPAAAPLAPLRFLVLKFVDQPRFLFVPGSVEDVLANVPQSVPSSAVANV